MELKPLDKSDLELVDAAKVTIQKHYAPMKHVVSAAIRTGEGAIITAVHLEAFVGRIAVCAEAVASREGNHGRASSL
jgi:cytidine deaminase